MEPKTGKVTGLPAVAVVGAGRVGTVLGRALFTAGYRVCAVTSREPANAARLAGQVGARIVAHPVDVLPEAELILLTVADDAIGPVVAQMQDGDWSQRPVIAHTSGITSLRVFDSLVQHGARAGGLHPIAPFADAAMPVEALRGVVFAVSADEIVSYNLLADMVRAMGGLPFVLADDHRAGYHAALVMASNYLVTLYDTAQVLLGQSGMSSDLVAQALLSLMRLTLENLAINAPAQALTGPIARGDAGTVSAHIAALASQPDVLAAYISLARLTLPLARERGMANDAVAAVLEQASEGGRL